MSALIEGDLWQRGDERAIAIQTHRTLQKHPLLLALKTKVIKEKEMDQRNEKESEEGCAGVRREREKEREKQREREREREKERGKYLSVGEGVERWV
jgi:hypothetical protein